MSTKTSFIEFFGTNHSRLQLILVALLVTQLVLIVSLAGFNRLSESQEQSPLLNFDPKKVTKILIEDNSKSPSKLTLLMNSKADWILPDTYGFPASSELVHKTLDALAALKKGYALATTIESRERYKVGDSDCLQKICLFEGEKLLGQLLIGKSLSGSSYALRSANDSDICSGTLPCSRVTTESEYWIDKRVATIKVKNIALIDMGKFSLENFDENWKLLVGKKSELFSFQNLRTLIYPVANCKIISVLGKKAEPDFDLNNPLLSFKIRMRDGEERKYVVSKERKSGLYVIKISNLPWFCVANQQDIDKVRDFSAEDIRNLRSSLNRKHSGIDLKGVLKKIKDEVEQSRDVMGAEHSEK